MSNTPQIRFAGFTDAWEQRKVGEWGNFYYGHSCPKWSVTEDATTPCIRYGEMYTKFGCKIDRVYSYTNIPKENLKFSKGTEVLVPRVGEDPMDYNHCTWLSLANVAIGEMISVYNTEQNPMFTAIMFNATLKYEFAKRVEGGSVTNLYYEKLLEIPVSFPIIEEQKKIASFFENLDTLITLHQRKCDALQKFKKSMLQKMFPQNGESVPEIRFAGFTDAWEQRKLGDLAVEVKRKADKDSDAPVMMISASEGFIDQSQRYSNNNAGSSLKNYTLLYEGELAYNHGYSKFRNFGSVFDLKVEKARIPFVYHSFALPEDDHRFFAYYLNSGLFDGELKKLVSSTARMDGLLNISYEDYMSIPVLRPPVQEQEKIGRFLTSLDTLITLHQRKLETLQKMKKSLLQKMFV